MKREASSSSRRGGAAAAVGGSARATIVAVRILSVFENTTALSAKAFAQRAARRGSGKRHVMFMLPVSVAMPELIAFSIVRGFSPIPGATSPIVAGALT